MQKSLKGLVLAGGKSSRMGTDKARISWHGKEQQYYLADLLALFCEDVFVSCRQNQQPAIQSNYKVLTDNYTDAGPMAAILTAFEKYPDCSWLVMACDVPLIDQPTLTYLIAQKDPAMIATVFQNAADGLPEPLIGIWEPASCHLLKTAHQKQQFSLRKILVENGAKMIKAPEADALMNANTPEDTARIEKMIGLKNAFFTS